MNKENKPTIESFVNDFNVTLDSNKQISLYDLLRKKCPNTIKNLEEKINGKHFIPKSDKENKWYTAVINYLTMENFLETEKDENGTYHNVSENYKKYFIHSTSSLYAPKNCKNHLMLYKQTANEFLIKSGILNKDGTEFIKGKQPKNKLTFINKYSKLIKFIFSVILFISIVNYVLMVSKYGITVMTPFLCNTCLFSISILITTSKLD